MRQIPVPLALKPPEALARRSMSAKAISEHLSDFDSLTDADLDAAMSSSSSRRFTQSRRANRCNRVLVLLHCISKFDFGDSISVQDSPFEVTF